MLNNELLNKLDKLKEPRILIIGDFALDEMVFGNTERISREAPVLILEHYETKKILGAASNAAHNVSRLNQGKASALGVYGDDYYGKELLRILEEKNIDTSLMVLDKSRKTTTKTRISGSCNQSITQQIVRIDRQTKTPIDSNIEDIIIRNIEQSINSFDGIILSDYHLGCLTPRVIQAAINQAKKHNKLIVADIQKDMEKYKGVDVITPNQPDSEKQVGFFIKSEQDLINAGIKLLKDLDLKKVLITRGENGMALFEKIEENTAIELDSNKKIISCDNKQFLFSRIPAFNKKEVFDVTGAGDTVVAAFTLALCSGLSAYESMCVGNLAASIVIRYFGCHTIAINDLKEEFRIKE